jgi:hypothetical protein
MIKETFDNYLNSAKGLGDFQSLTKTQLANGYCDAEEAGDMVKRDQYFSALMLRYWFKVMEFYRNSPFVRQEPDDFSSWIAESLNVAFKYRQWRNPSHPLNKDPNGPDKVINKCLFSTRKRWHKYANQDKRRVNFFVESIEEHFEKYENKSQSLTEHVEYADVQSSSQAIVQLYLNRGKYIEAIIIDHIAHYNSFSFKSSKKGEKKDYVFSKVMLVKELAEIDETYISNFKDIYSVKEENLLEAIEEIKSQTEKRSKNKLLKYINYTFETFKGDSKAKELLSLR